MDVHPDAVLSLVDAAARTLARPSGARLLVDGLGPSGDLAAGVELVDRHGLPLLLCDPCSALAGAARATRGAVLTLRSADGRHLVVFRGRLVPAGRDRTGDHEVERVELRLSGLHVGATGDGDAVPVPLADYHRHRDPDLAAYAEALRAHTDQRHGAELRELAARLSGAADRTDGADPHDVVAAARLLRLDCTGTVLRWVDLDGAHEVRLVFPRPARTRRELGEHLRHTLRPPG